MRTPVAAAAALVVLSFAAPSLAVDDEAVDACHQAILRGLAAVDRGRIAHVGRCLKEGNYDGCVETDFHAAVHENELRNHVAGETSDCAAALASGASLDEFGPTTCSNEWESCDTEFPSISSLSDLAECLLCQERGYDLYFRSVLGMPRPAPTDTGERRCTRLVAGMVNNTIRKSIYDTMACAEGNTKPFACPVDATGDSRFGAALAKFAKRIALCGIDDGEAPGVLVHLCGGTATDAASLTECFRGFAKCIACRTANTALDQAEDCVAFSGYAGCDGMF